MLPIEAQYAPIVFFLKGKAIQINNTDILPPSYPYVWRITDINKGEELIQLNIKINIGIRSN